MTFQYLTVDSSQLQKNDQKAFVFENDTLRITYDFSGGGGPLNITVFNKSNQPLSIDWNKSALVCNSRSFSLAKTNSIFTGTATGYRGLASLTGTLKVDPGFEIVPPQTTVTRLTIYLDQSLPSFRVAIPDTAQKQKAYFPGGAVRKYTMARFDEAASPIQLKTYLTFLIGPGTGTEFSETSMFYISKAMQTANAPDMFPLYQQPGDQLYVSWRSQD
jgi:hypothetical protein